MVERRRSFPSSTHTLPAICLLAIAFVAPRAFAAEPTLLDYLHACGIGDDAFAHFADDRRVAGEELEVVRRIAVRLRDCPPDRLDRLIAAGPAAALPAPAEAKSKRGQLCRIQGTLTSAVRVADPGREDLWWCTLTPGESSHGIAVYVADLPESLRSSRGTQVALEGVFVKYMPGVKDAPEAVVVAPRIERRGDSCLAKLGMDLHLLAGIQDQSPLAPADHDAFYRMLELARNADPACLDPDARRLDDSPAGVPALFRDPARERGRLVRLDGVARSVVRVPIDDPAVSARLRADHYFEIDLLAGGSEGNPLVLCTLDLPEGMPLGGPPSYGENLEVAGFFLKTWQYSATLSAEEKTAHPGASRALQTAAVLIGPAPHWEPAAVQKKSPLSGAVGGLVALVTLGVCLLLWRR